MMDKKILIVDDDPNVAAVLTGPLKEAGATVETALTYENALTAIKTFNPDAVILDVVLKEGKSGLDFAKEIHKMPEPHPFIIVLTNAINPDEIVRGMEIDITTFLQKAEIDPKEVVNTLSKHFTENVAS